MKSQSRDHQQGPNHAGMSRINLLLISVVCVGALFAWHSGPSDPARSSTAASPHRRFRQFSIRTLLLLTAAIAVWTAFVTNYRQNKFLETRIAAMRPLARELLIEDPHRIAVVKLDELWYDENTWDLYLPPGQYRLFLATDEIDDKDLAPVRVSTLLAGGRHRLAFDQQREEAAWRLSVRDDDAEILTVKEPLEWNPARGSSGGGHFSQCAQLPIDQPVILFRRRFSRGTGDAVTGAAAQQAVSRQHA